MITRVPGSWDRTVDVVIVGSGAAALVAATLASDHGAEVLVLEKQAMLGGTSAVSGGVMWVPVNHHMAEAGIADSHEAAVQYIRRLTMGHEPDPALIEVFVHTADEMLAYLEAHTPLRTAIVPHFPDYYFEYDVPGKTAGGRSIEPLPYAVGDELPDWKDRLVKRTSLMSLGAVTTLGEDLGGGGVDPALRDELAAREARDIRSKGAALVAMLFKGLRERYVEVSLNTAVGDLVIIDGEVVGVSCVQDGVPTTIGARRGVVLACGGFEWNRDMVRSYIGFDLYPVSPPNNVGDGHVMAMQAGAALANMNSFWGTGAMLDPGISDGERLVPQFDSARGTPGTLIVNSRGVRFVNESVPYNDFPKAFGAFDPAGLSFPNEAPAWMIFDEQVKDTTPILSIVPGQPVPDWVPRGDSIEALAHRIGVDADTLQATIARFNDHMAAGDDPDFGRGRVGFHGLTDLRPVQGPPFYAVAIYPGTLGTNGGPRLSANGEVLRHGGGVIPGLYAAGNAAANVFGWAYPSGGGTLVNGATFGYLAGRHAAGATRQFWSDQSSSTDAARASASM